MNCNSSIHGMLGGGGGGEGLKRAFYVQFQFSVSIFSRLIIGMSELTDISFSRTCNHKDSNGFCNAYGFQ